MKCNIIEYHDGLNISLGWHAKGWYGTSRPACNEPATSVGVWHSPITEKPYFVYCCDKHLEGFIDLVYEPHLKRGWFKLVGRIKDRRLENEPALP